MQRPANIFHEVETKMTSQYFLSLNKSLLGFYQFKCK